MTTGLTCCHGGWSVALEREGENEHQEEENSEAQGEGSHHEQTLR